MFDSTIAAYMAEHPKLTGILVSGITALSLSGVAAAGGGVHGP